MFSRQGVGPSTLQSKGNPAYTWPGRKGDVGEGCTSRFQEPGSPLHGMRCGVQGSPPLSVPGWIVPHISLATAHLMATEDSDLLMVIKGLDDPLACHGFLGSQGLLWVTPPACTWAHLPQGTGGSILSTHSFSHRFLAFCYTLIPVLGALFPELGRHRPQ